MKSLSASQIDLKASETEFRLMLSLRKACSLGFHQFIELMTFTLDAHNNPIVTRCECKFECMQSSSFVQLCRWRRQQYQHAAAATVAATIDNSRCVEMAVDSWITARIHCSRNVGIKVNAKRSRSSHVKYQSNGKHPISACLFIEITPFPGINAFKNTNRKDTRTTISTWHSGLL